MKSSSLLGGLVLAAGITGAAMAQDAPQAPPAPTDVSNIGDWTVHCYAVNSPNPCEMVYAVVDKNTRQRVLAVTIAYVPSADKHLLLVGVPLGISIPKGLVIQTDTVTTPVLHYRRCDQAGCYVEMVLENAMVDQISHSGANAAVRIFSDSGKNFDLHLSLNGFAGAHDKMAELAKQKAKTPPQTINASPAATP
jgi:invasion protein IalB